MSRRRSAVTRVASAVLAMCWTAGASAQTPESTHEDHVQATSEPRDAVTRLPDFIPPLTDEDRRAAFPRLREDHVHERALRAFVLLDHLEWRAGGGTAGVSLDSRGWIGGDRDRLWFRVEGDSDDGQVAAADVHALFGRRVLRWWDVVGGVRHDMRPGEAQTWAAAGIQGIAPYGFDIDVFGYVGAFGRTQARVDAKYELLMTNRLVLQPLVEIDLSGHADPERGLGAGLTATNTGVRLRYEFRREIAPYVGVNWHRVYGGTAALAEHAGEPTTRTEVVTGLRLWF